MTGNYFKISWRLLYRNKVYSLLNILGLVFGMMVFIFIFLYVESEIGYDRHWTNQSEIYRLTNTYVVDQKEEKIALTPYRLASDIKKAFPGVIEATRIFFTDPSDENDVTDITYQDRVFEVPDISLSDEYFFRLFDFDFLEGSPDSALARPHSIVISKQVAKAIFGDQPALGKLLRTNLREYQVTGVIDKSSKPSHLNFDALVSVSSLEPASLKQLERDYFWMTCYTYVQLNDTVNPDRIEFDVNNLMRKGESEFIDAEKLKLTGNLYYSLEKLTNVHFNTALSYDSPTNVPLSNLIMFSTIAMFILLTASINYINLSTARSLKRAREVGVRKVLGAGKKQLMWLYISESLILTAVSFVLAMAMVELLIPMFNQLVGKQFSLMFSLFSPENLVFGSGLFVLILLLAVLGGSFPAFVLNAFLPAQVLRGTAITVGKGGRHAITAGMFRKFLVVIQFVFSIAMIMSTIIVYEQMKFLSGHELGFDTDDVLVVNVPNDTSFRKQMPEIIEYLRNAPSIVETASAQHVPGFTEGKQLFQLGDTSINPAQTINYFGVGLHFFELLKVTPLQGRLFDENDLIDEGRFILNQSALDFLGIDSLITTNFNLIGRKGGRVVGVVNNINTSSLHRKVEPMVFVLNTDRPRYLLVKAKPDSLLQAMNEVTNAWKKYRPSANPHFIALQDKLDSLYNTDRKMLRLFFYFSLMVLVISSLGLWGLSSFLIQQRTREIGIRRVLGGSSIKLIVMLSMDYLRLVFLAGIIATPLVWILMKRWLEGFAYHITVQVSYFVISIVLALMLAAFTILIRSLRIVHEKPAVSLHSD